MPIPLANPFFSCCARHLAEVKRLLYGNPLSTTLAKAYANHPWSVTEPEAVGVPEWQTGTKALCLYSQSSQACKPVRRAPTWLTTPLVEWNALHTILGCGRHCVGHNAPVEYKKTLQFAISTRAGPAEDDPPLYKLGSKPVQAV